MSLYPFPARSDIPPPVPPKTSAVTHISACAVTVKAPKHKKSSPSLSKAMSFDSFVNLHTSRNNSPTKQLEGPDISILPISSTESPIFMQGKTTPILISPKEDCASPDMFNSPPKLLSLVSAKQRAKGVFTARRKGSIVDLETMTTVQEYCMDSQDNEGEQHVLTYSGATIPGRPAFCQEQGSTANTWRQCAFGEILLSSLSPPPSVPQGPIDNDFHTERPISPLALPSSSNTPWPGTTKKTDSVYDIPPQVPPKTNSVPQKTTFLESRIMENRVIENKLVERPADIRNMERPLGSRPTESRYMERPKSPAAIMERTRDHYIPTRPRADSAPPTRTHSRRNGESIARPGSADPLAPTKWHRRKKSNISSDTLPQGVRPSKAPDHFPYSQLELLQAAAKLRSEKFDILNAKDVEGLSKELSQLETRCQYLKETHKSLRAGRRTLHTRTITYLRSARSAIFSRENLLKQEEALAELDAAIEDWEFKLEKAEERRAKVKEKLLEHVAAALTVSNFAYSPSERGVSTPPATPERQRRERESEKESITIYALLADVEQEINRSTRYRD